MQMVFSSSCTVYGNPSKVPIDETHPLSAVSPYGRTKLIIEDIFRDYAEADKGWRTILLRYFNPVGAHPSGDLGPTQTPVQPDSCLPTPHFTHPQANQHSVGDASCSHICLQCPVSSGMSPKTKCPPVPAGTSCWRPGEHLQGPSTFACCPGSGMQACSCSPDYHKPSPCKRAWLPHCEVS